MLKNSPVFRPLALSSTGLLRSLSRFFLFTASLTTLVLAQSASAETFYKWVDKAGSTHYTQTPPGKNSAKSAKKVYIDDLAPPTPVAPANTENSNSNANTGTTNGNSNSGNATSVMDANQLANAATNGSVPNTNGQQQAPQTTTAPQPQPVITPITPPPANRLIVPTQDQTRPAFSER
ncbi:DUF4124 domain-containing protein [Alkanindiges illinoisensis]|uniref:DUF4124 domain-containing protein n=1 Tax=Alkanindiges illinoisensis TaxID=197183 RepID=UPI00054E6F7E|nr:DUF4124 domain-containing protein [Alkanindiges illinoisensis]